MRRPGITEPEDVSDNEDVEFGDDKWKVAIAWWFWQEKQFGFPASPTYNPEPIKHEVKLMGLQVYHRLLDI